jgi:hypothetical protein
MAMRAKSIIILNNVELIAQKLVQGALKFGVRVLAFAQLRTGWGNPREVISEQ